MEQAGERTKTRRAQSTKDDIKATIEEAVAPIKDETAKLSKLDICNEMLENLGKVLKKEIEEQLKSRDERISKLEEKIDILESKLCLIEHLDKKIDDCEQYSTRDCLRIDNIPVPEQDGEENCIEKIDVIMQSLDCCLQRNDIDRANRIGPMRKNGYGVVGQQMIVKFKYFNARTRMYCNRKKVQNEEKTRMDLIKRRLNILLQAFEFAKTERKIDFVFADINCNLAAKLRNGNLVYFDSIVYLKEKLEKPQ